MRKRAKSRLGIIIIASIGLIVVVAAGAAIYVALSNNNNNETASKNTAKDIKALRAECIKKHDADICQMAVNWQEASKNYRITATGGGATSLIEINDDRYHTKVDSGSIVADLISIGKDTYTRAGDVWYKRTLTSTTQALTNTESLTFDDLLGKYDESVTKEDQKKTYKSVGKEACGDRQCFKYEMTDPADPGSVSIIWFDTKEYKPRKVTTTLDGATSEATIEYGNVTIAAPTNVRELAEDEYLEPGKTTPTKLPSSKTMQQQKQ